MTLRGSDLKSSQGFRFRQYSKWQIGGYNGVQNSKIRLRHRVAIPTTNLPVDVKARIHAIKPAAWPRAKIKGIDVSIKELERLGMSDRWI
jgi:hypothetical protein